MYDSIMIYENIFHLYYYILNIIYILLIPLIPLPLLLSSPGLIIQIFFNIGSLDNSSNFFLNILNDSSFGPWIWNVYGIYYHISN